MFIATFTEGHNSRKVYIRGFASAHPDTRIDLKIEKGGVVKGHNIKRRK
jgi:hypothetical protein